MLLLTRAPSSGSLAVTQARLNSQRRSPFGGSFPGRFIVKVELENVFFYLKTGVA